MLAGILFFIASRSLDSSSTFGRTLRRISLGAAVITFVVDALRQNQLPVIALCARGGTSGGVNPRSFPTA